MADFRLGRLKFNWRGAWAASTAYVIDDIISFKGNTYVCVVNHVSAASETLWYDTDLDIATPRWQLHVPGIRIMGAWTPNTFYAKNDLISYGANQYLCVNDHTSAANENLFYSSDLTNWSLYTSSTQYLGEWSVGTWYKLNDIVKYGNTLYNTTIAHTSGIQFDETKFDVYLESLNFEDTWNSQAEYQPGDIVTFGGYSYIAETIHSGKQPNIYNVIPPGGGVADWKILTTGFNVVGEYSNTTVYVPGDVVQFGGNTFVKVTTGSAGVYPTDTSAWELVSKGLNWRGPWSNSSTYQVNDVVSKQSASWVNLTPQNINIDPVEDQTVSTEVKTWTASAGTTLVGEANTTYTAVATTSNGSGTGATFTVTRDGSGAISTIVVVDKGTSYATGNTITISGANIGGSSPTDDVVLTLTAIGSGTGGANWQAVAQGESTLTLQNPGDILYRNSAGANVNLPIGAEGEILTVSENGVPAWERNNNCANVFYVTTDGVDDPDYGKNISKPWRTLRYALSQIPTGTQSNINTIFVKSGKYEEQLPLVVPEYTSIVGDNLRATIIAPDPNTQSTDPTPVENRFSTMFYLSESTTLKDLVFVDMEGFEPAVGEANITDITQATVRGVFLRLNPATPILGKSPYITQCSAFSGRPPGTAANCTGGVGALVDKSVYGATTSNGSMLFDSFTQFHDLGVGFWCKDLGNAEVVSCFTYYCHIGYTCTGGGRIRSLAGNNSWGNYGSVSSGFDVGEVPVTGTVRGLRLNFSYDELSAVFKQNEEVVQGTANAVDSFTASSGTTIGGAANGEYTGVATTSGGTGTGATFDVSRDGSGAISAVAINAKGGGYAESDTLTILGSLIGGVDTTDDITVTVDSVAADTSISNPNYAKALILYVQAVSDDENYLLIEPITGTFTNSKPIVGVGKAAGATPAVIASGATGITLASDAVEGIRGKIFPLTNLPIIGGVVQFPKITGATKFNPVTGNTAYDDDSYYVIQDVVGTAESSNLFLDVLRENDVPGAPATDLTITSLSRVGGVSTVVTSSAHGLNTGDKVTIVIPSSAGIVRPFATGYSIVDSTVLGIREGVLQRTTVTVVNTTTFTYEQTGFSDATPSAGDLANARVYKQGTTGGGTKSLHLGGTSVTLYNVSSSTATIENSLVDDLSASATSILFSDAFVSVFNSITPGPNTFLLVNNEMMNVTGKSGGALTVTRGAEGTTAAIHADNSTVYVLTKQTEATTIRGDVDTAVTEIPLFSIDNFDTNDIIKVNDEFFRITAVNSPTVGIATILFAQPKIINANNGQSVSIRLRYSQVRLTGHDFLLVGTGGKASTNWPNQPLQSADQEKEVVETFPGRVYYTSTDQDGNFRVGTFFRVEQATGSATLNATDFDLAGLAKLRLGSLGAELGVEINEFSADATLGGEFSRDSACPTQLAVKTYVDSQGAAGINRVKPELSVASIISVGTQATITTNTQHNVFAGDTIVVSGAEQANYNGTFVVDEVNVLSKTIRYTLLGTATSPALGIISVERKQRVSSDLTVEGNFKVIPTWNDTASLNALDIDVTNTQSGSQSTLLSAKVGGVSKFSVDRDGNISAAGGLSVQGTLTTINSTNLSITDKEVIVADGATNGSTADGAGLQLGTSNLSFKYDNANTRWNLPNAALNIGGSLRINGTEVITSSALGSAITSSSLTTVGALSSLTVTGQSKIKSVNEEIEVRPSGQTGNQTYSYNTASIFWNPSPANNINVLLTDVPTDAYKVHSIAVVFAQGGTARTIGSFSVNGSPVTIKWADGEQPTGNANKTDAFNFTVINTSGTAGSPSWTVIGSSTSFG